MKIEEAKKILWAEIKRKMPIIGSNDSCPPEVANEMCDYIGLLLLEEKGITEINLPIKE